MQSSALKRCLAALATSEAAYRAALTEARNNGAEIFRMVREGLGWSQVELAEFLGITQPYVSCIESGKYRPGPVPLVKLATLKNVPEKLPALWQLAEDRERCK